MLRHVGVDQKKEYTSVEELGNEDSICDLRESFTICVVSDRLNQVYYHIFENKINGNDDERN